MRVPSSPPPAQNAHKRYKRDHLRKIIADVNAAADPTRRPNHLAPPDHCSAAPDPTVAAILSKLRHNARVHSAVRTHAMRKSSWRCTSVAAHCRRHAERRARTATARTATAQRGRALPQRSTHRISKVIGVLEPCLTSPSGGEDVPPLPTCSRPVHTMSGRARVRMPALSRRRDQSRA